ncbi:Sushi, von Willebrand factor type A, EGF and pentraxin domain-containing protein 1 [Exaiptasia diaphana]|nr:Sushi, von Willebrand factor type A, EGF and pentraxin domain-containing protein 1 [Exaiptasia diaphana]
MQDVEHGIRCVYHCNPGYELRGPRYVSCNNTKWTENAPVSCVRVYNQPWIQCPTDVVVQLPPSSNSFVLGYRWRPPKTNMKKVAVSPTNLNENYAFPAGKTRVKWTATNQDGVSKSCFYYVIVEDKTPPTAVNCPSKEIVVKGSNHLITVSWTEPTFTDNVAVVMTMSSKRPGHQMERDTSLNVRYTAVDAAGNTAHCDFRVSAEGTICPKFATPPNSRIMQTPMLLFLNCNFNYYFNPKPEGARSYQNVVYNCRFGKWQIYNQGNYVTLTKIPGCAGFSLPDGNGKCKPGSTLEDGKCKTFVVDS